jgi:hypothetical protein
MMWSGGCFGGGLVISFRAAGKRKGRKQFFFAKKNQKTLVYKASALPHAYTKRTKVFASFFKKKCFLPVDASASRL